MTADVTASVAADLTADVTADVTNDAIWIIRFQFQSILSQKKLAKSWRKI